MEKAKVQRIVGVLVILSFIVIILPLLINKNMSTQTVSMDAPAFNTEDIHQEKIITANNTNTDSTQQIQEAKTPVNTPPVVASQVAPTLPAPPVKPVMTAAPKVSTQPLAASETKKSTVVISSTPKIVMKQRAIKNKIVAIAHAHVTSGWAIQVGTFRNQKNVDHLIEKLHAEGYQTRIKKTPSGTLVFVSPQNNRQIALHVASNINKRLNIRSMVVKYDLSKT